MEIWKDISGYEGIYQVSDFGRVRSLDRMINSSHGAMRLHRGRILKPQRKKSGHFHVGLRVDGVCNLRYVHRLVLFAFVGPPKTGQECLHIVSDPGNNCLENLKWGTRRENVHQAVKEGAVSALTSPSSQKVQINDILYHSMHEAARKLGMYRSTVVRRCRNPRKSDWQFIEEKEVH